MSQTYSKILNAYPETEFNSAPGFNEAVIGVDLDEGRLIYSVSKCIDVLVYVDNMAFEDAVEYFEEHVRKAFDDVEDGPIWANTEF
jgi:hypothetical protein